MLTSIKKFTKSFLAKVLIGIIMLAFVFVGTGDLFRTGNQNVLVTIDSEKISAQSFVDYVNRLNLKEQQRNNLAKTDLLDRILSDYIGKKIINLEIADQGINLNNQSLRKIIISDKTFQENNKFSRTAYEKFLLESNLSANVFEQNIAEQEKKRQLLTFLSEGINIPELLIKKQFDSENQVKTIQYLQLDDLYKSYSVPEKEIKKIYESNKNLFTQDYKKMNYIELLPNNLIGQKDYNQAYFKKIDEIENNVLDGIKMSDFVKEYDLSLKVIEEANFQKKNKAGEEIKIIGNELFNKIFNLKTINKPELINLNNKYYLGEILTVKKVSKSSEDKEIKEVIISQLKLRHAIENNTKIVQEMSVGIFNKEQFQKFGKKNKLKIKRIVIKNIKDETTFNSDIIKEIFKIKDGELQLITNSEFSKNYIILSEKTEKLPFSKNDKDYDQYKRKARLSLANEIYGDFDKTVNNKYDVEINENVLTRIKNTL